MFCSIECYNYAMRNFHQFECSIMPQLLKSASVNIALRIFFIGLSICENSIDKLETLFIQTVNQQPTLFDFDLSNAKNIDYDKNYFQSILSLSRSTKVFSMSQYIHILSVHSTLNETFSTHRKFVINFLEHICQVADHNFHAIFSGSLKLSNEMNAKTLQQSIGTGCLPFTSLINHSCTPNIMRICNDANVIAIVCRPVEKGSQIFDCYK
jgi:SET domain